MAEPLRSPRGDAGSAPDVPQPGRPARPADRLLAASLAVSILAASCVVVGSGTGDPYAEEIRSWRSEREARLKADGGWLTVAGLFRLEEGENRFGTDASLPIRLPEGSAPPIAGAFTLRDGATTVSIEPGVAAFIDGEGVTTAVMRPDSSGAADVLSLNDLTMYVIERSGRLYIRLKDPNSRFRKEFTGLTWYPVSGAYRVEGRFVPYEPPREIAIPTILDTVEPMVSPGYVLFTIGGAEMRLDPVLEDPSSGELFFIFSDRTSGRETYPAGRFLKTPLPADGRVMLDFNRAYNPPCAFTPYATCPLPPPQNRLAAAIEAGEKNYGHH